MIEPTTPVDTYKAIIDQLADETRLAGFGSYVETTGKFSNAPDHREFNEFTGSLSTEQRHLIALMLQTERDNTIHDVLANLTWWMTCRNVSLSVDRSSIFPKQKSIDPYGFRRGIRLQVLPTWS